MDNVNKNINNKVIKKVKFNDLIKKDFFEINENNFMKPYPQKYITDIIKYIRDLYNNLYESYENLSINYKEISKYNNNDIELLRNILFEESNRYFRGKRELFYTYGYILQLINKRNDNNEYFHQIDNLCNIFSYFKYILLRLRKFIKRYKKHRTMLWILFKVPLSKIKYLFTKDIIEVKNIDITSDTSHISKNLKNKSDEIIFHYIYGKPSRGCLECDEKKVNELNLYEENLKNLYTKYLCSTHYNLYKNNTNYKIITNIGLFLEDKNVEIIK
jgi:hypothetical protein